MSLADVQLQRKRRKEALQTLAGSPLYHRILEVLSDDLEDLRVAYESEQASEFNRGRVAQQRALIQLIESRGA